MTRATLQEIFDQIPESEVGAYAALIQAYRTNDRVLIQSLLAPETLPKADENSRGDDIEDAEPLDVVCERLGLP